MKACFRRAAVVVLAVVLFAPLTATASSRDRDRGRDRAELVLRTIQKIRKFLRISPTGDVLTPPNTNPAPPPPPTDP